MYIDTVAKDSLPTALRNQYLDFNNRNFIKTKTDAIATFTSSTGAQI
jgi:hypothetical protein